MPEPQRNQGSLTAKAFTIFGVGVLLGFGMCAFGAQDFGSRGAGRESWVGIGLIVFLISCAGLVVTVLIAVVKGLFGK